MILYAICTEGVNGPEPLYDSETGSPDIFMDKLLAEEEVQRLNTHTAGGYFFVEFQTEDEKLGY